MDVILKKSKITGAVITQSMLCKIDDLVDSKIIGWCIFKTVKFIIIYFESQNIIKKFPLLYTLRIYPKDEENPESSKWIVSVNYSYQTRVDYLFDNEDQAKQTETKINEGKKIAVQKGQFYI